MTTVPPSQNMPTVIHKTGPSSQGVSISQRTSTRAPTSNPPIDAVTEEKVTPNPQNDAVTEEKQVIACEPPVLFQHMRTPMKYLSLTVNYMSHLQ